jgi:hypothetical protein
MKIVKRRAATTSPVRRAQRRGVVSQHVHGMAEYAVQINEG